MIKNDKKDFSDLSFEEMNFIIGTKPKKNYQISSVVTSFQFF